MYVEREEELFYLFLREENLRYANLTRIFQKLGLHYHINAKFSKTMCAYFILPNYENLLQYKLLNIHP